MEELTPRHKEMLRLGKQMKEIIRLSEKLTINGHPLVNRWVERVREFAYGSNEPYIFYSFCTYEFTPRKSELFDILIYFRRLLKDEGLFSDDLVE